MIYTVYIYDKSKGLYRQIAQVIPTGSVRPQPSKRENLKRTESSVALREVMVRLFV